MLNLLKVKIVLLFLVFVVACPVNAQQCDNPEECTSFALTDVAASLNTQGYYIQSKLLEQVRFNILGGQISGEPEGRAIRLIAPLMYIVAIIGAIFMMGFGQPPKMWIWFLVGPGIFHFLVNTTVDKKGVQWVMATTPELERRVWEMSQVGITNLPSSDSGIVQANRDSEPNSPAKVSQIFALYDDFVSSMVMLMVKWVGVFNQREGNLSLASPGGAGEVDSSWFILSNSKWPMLEGITASLSHNSTLREALVTYMAGECGDIVSENVDKGVYGRAQKGGAIDLPMSVMKSAGTSSIPDYTNLVNSLRNMPIPLESTYRELLAKPNTPGHRTEFAYFNTFTENVDIRSLHVVTCMDMLRAIIHGLRFETGHVYFNTLEEAGRTLLARDGSNRDEVFASVIYNFLYGWHFEDVSGATAARPKLTDEQREIFMKNLIFWHLFRNELSMAPKVNNPRMAAASRIVEYGEIHQATMGSKQKFSELYQWAKLIPYMQGMLLYFLCFSYPICCMLMVVPGWWKTLITWASFYAWAKSWDLGFAIVMTLERTIWSMLGSSKDAEALNAFVLDGGQYQGFFSASNLPAQVGNVDYTCVGGDCSVLQIRDAATAVGDNDIAAVLDLGLLLSGVLDYDLTNSYYIYLMSALYFAVPAVTGQILLGAKAGAAGLVTNAFQQSASEFGGKAGAGALDYDVTRRMNAKESAVQEGAAASQRANGLAAQALAAQNQGAVQGWMASRAGATSSLLGTKNQMLNWEAENAKQAAAIEQTVDKAAVQLGVDGVRGLAHATSKSAPGTGAATGSTTGAFSLKGIGGKISDIASKISSGDGRGLVELGGSQANMWVQDIPGQIKGHAISAVAQEHMAAIASQQAGYQMLSTYGQAESGRLQQSAGRLEAAAQHQASEGTYRKQRDFGESMSGRLGAMGMSPGAMAAGPRSTDYRGLAAAGRLDGGAATGRPSAAESYNFFQDGNMNGMSGHINAGMGATYGALGNAGIIKASSGDYQNMMGAATSGGLNAQGNIDYSGHQHSFDLQFQAGRIDGAAGTDFMTATSVGGVGGLGADSAAGAINLVMGNLADARKKP